MKIDLSDTTFIIPLKIESEDRYKNAQIVLNFLYNTFETNIFIYELGGIAHWEEDAPNTESSLVSEITKNMETVTLFYEPSTTNDGSDKIFHRTQYLNYMLNRVRTPVTVNYDIDVLLDTHMYLKAQQIILSGELDLLYPFGYGHHNNEVSIEVKDELISSVTSLGARRLHKLMRENSLMDWCCSGHLQFFNSKVYVEGGMENENFISYGPEDKERLYRFKRLGYKVSHQQGSEVFHLSHHRGPDSGKTNESYIDNVRLYTLLMQLTPKDLQDYYDKQEYTDQYDIYTRISSALPPPEFF